MNSQKRTQKQPKLNNFVCPKSMTLEEWQVALRKRLRHIRTQDTERKANTLPQLLTEQGQPDRERC